MGDTKGVFLSFIIHGVELADGRMSLMPVVFLHSVHSIQVILYNFLWNHYYV